MRFLYVTDLHGDEKKYNKLLEISLKLNIKLIVNGGDMLPKLGKNIHKEQFDFMHGFLSSYFSKLQENGITYLAILGNDDLRINDSSFDGICSKFKKTVKNLHNKNFEFENYEFIGLHNILDHPFGCKDRVVYELPETHQQQLSNFTGLSNEDGYYVIKDWHHYKRTKLPQMKDILNSLPIPKDLSKTIYVMHMPPAGLKLGQLRYQDLDIGSVDISEFVLKKQPLMTLHGHIHEAPDTEKGTWKNKIDKTLCFQPGQTEFNSDKIIYLYIDLENMLFERKETKI